jgi:hypothetical protein
MQKPKTVEEFLAQGGTITKCPVVEIAEKMQNVRSMTTGPAKLMSLEEGELMYGEKTTRKKKEKALDLSGIDMENIPEELRKTLGI